MLALKRVFIVLLVLTLALTAAGGMGRAQAGPGDPLGMGPANGVSLRVLLAPSMPATGVTVDNLKTALESFGMTVGIFNTATATPDDSYVTNYDAVITWKQLGYPYADKTAMGDFLAKFVDNNKGVVLAEFNDAVLGGGITKYSPFYQKGGAFPESADMVDWDEVHPLMDGVASITASNRPYVAQREDVRSEVIAYWSDAVTPPPFVGLNGEGSVIGIAGPPPVDGGTYSGEFLRLYVNSALYVILRPRITEISGTIIGSSIAPIDVSFTVVAEATEGAVMEHWLWDFEGTGTIDDDNDTPIWKYTYPGTYQAACTVMDSFSRTSTKVVPIGAGATFDGYTLPGPPRVKPERAYRMVTLPVVPFAAEDNDVFTMLKDSFGGVYNPSVWLLYKSYPYANKSYPEITKAGDDVAAYGKGWWIISSQKKNVGDVVVSGVPTFSDVSFAVSNGYQMIGSPYTDVTVDWAEVKGDLRNAVLNLEATIYSWDGGLTGDYNQVTTMEPGRAYWVKVNKAGGGTMFIPRPGVGDVALAAAASSIPLSHADPGCEPPPLPPGAELTLCSLNGGQHLWSGESCDIKWQGSGLSPQGFKSTVTISYSVNGGKTYTAIVRQTKNDGRYSWKVPRKESSNCLVKVVSDLYPGMVAKSSKVFKISVK